MNLQLTALVTLLNILLQFGTLALVGRARERYGVHAPAVSGHPVFERAYRVQMNTLEATLMFLPALWLASLYGYPRWAGWLGLVWIAGRILYAFGYMSAPSRRSLGFMIALVSWVGLVILAAIGIGHALMLNPLNVMNH